MTTCRKPATLPLVFTLLAAFAACAPRAPVQEADLAITGATLIDGTGAPAREAMTVLVDDGRIAAVVPAGSVRAAEGARVIDAAGEFVLPGLADMHVHLGTGGLEPQDGQTIPRVLRQFLFYGVTTVFSVGGSGGDAASVRELRAAAASGELVAPHLYATGSLLTLPGSHPVATIMRLPPGVDPATYDWSQRGVAVVSTVEEARSVVRADAEAGMDAIKIIVESGPTSFGDDHPQMSREMIRAVVDEAASHGLPVVAHTSSLDELQAAVASGVRAIMHATSEPFPGQDTWAEMRRRDVYYVPTLSLFVGLFGDRWTQPGATDDPFLRSGVQAETLDSLAGWQPPTAAMPDAARDAHWRQMLASIGAAHDAGVAIALGTDTNNPWVFPGYSVHEELELLVDAGLTPMQALVAATRRPAELLGEEDEFGTVEPGRRADLLVLSDDPLADIRNTRTLEVVVRGGEVVERSALLGAAERE